MDIDAGTQAIECINLRAFPLFVLVTYLCNAVQHVYFCQKVVFDHVRCYGQSKKNSKVIYK